MKLIIDDANLDTIKGLYEYFPVDGVTTNPTILAKEGKNPYEVLMAIREFIGPDAELHVQVVGKNADLIYEEAHMIRKRLGNNTFIKVPVTREGLKADQGSQKERISRHGHGHLYAHAGFSGWESRGRLRSPVCEPYRQPGCRPGFAKQKRYTIFSATTIWRRRCWPASFKNSQQALELAKHGVGSRHDLARCDRRPCCH